MGGVVELDVAGGDGVGAWRGGEDDGGVGAFLMLVGVEGDEGEEGLAERGQHFPVVCFLGGKGGRC